MNESSEDVVTSILTENGHEDVIVSDLNGTSSNEVDGVEDVTWVDQSVTRRSMCRLELE